MKSFRAPWSTSLRAISWGTTVLCGIIGLIMAWNMPGAMRWLALAPLVMVFGGALFTIRSYSIQGDVILVHRLFWDTPLPVAGLLSAQADPAAMRGSLRLCGNGGMFSFTGLFRNKTLGNYRAFVTDSRRAVVLRYPGRTVVLSPAEPEEFVRELPVADHGS